MLKILCSLDIFSTVIIRLLYKESTYLALAVGVILSDNVQCERRLGLKETHF